MGGNEQLQLIFPSPTDNIAFELFPSESARLWIRPKSVVSLRAFSAGKNKIVDGHQHKPAAVVGVMHASHTYRDRRQKDCEGIDVAQQRRLALLDGRRPHDAFPYKTVN